MMQLIPSFASCGSCCASTSSFLSDPTLFRCSARQGLSAVGGAMAFEAAGHINEMSATTTHHVEGLPPILTMFSTTRSRREHASNPANILHLPRNHGNRYFD